MIAESGVSVPYAELDRPVIGLVRAVNDLPGVQTFSSCGGHEGPGGAPAHLWWVAFKVELFANDLAPSSDGWVSLEWLAWFIGDMESAGRQVRLDVRSAPPFLNYVGEMLGFSIEGCRTGDGGIEPDEVAVALVERASELYVTVEEALDRRNAEAAEV